MRVMPNPIDKKIIKGAIPVDFRLIAYGCIWGVFIGLTNLSVSGDVDLAASKGTASFVSVTVGVFVGMRSALFATRMFRLWIARLGNRLELAEQRIFSLTGELGHDDPPKEPQEGSGFLRAKLKIYSVLLGGGFSAAGVGLVQLLIKTGTDIYGNDVYLVTLICLAVASFAILATAFELWSIGRTMSWVERRLDRAEGVPATPVVHTHDADIALRSTESWAYKITGMRGWQLGTVTA